MAREDFAVGRKVFRPANVATGVIGKGNECPRAALRDGRHKHAPCVLVSTWAWPPTTCRGKVTQRSRISIQQLGSRRTTRPVTPGPRLRASPARTFYRVR